MIVIPNFSETSFPLLAADSSSGEFMCAISRATIIRVEEEAWIMLSGSHRVVLEMVSCTRCDERDSDWSC